MNLKVISLRLSPETLAELRTLGRVESLKQRREVNLSDLIREAIDVHLRGQKPVLLRDNR